MIRQWTMGSALTQLRSFVSGVHVELDEVRRYIVRTDRVAELAAGRAARLAKRTPATTVAETAARDEPAASTQPDTPTSPAQRMDVDQAEESTHVRIYLNVIVFYLYFILIQILKLNNLLPHAVSVLSVLF